MSVTATAYQLEESRRHEARLSYASRMWSRRSADHSECVIARVEGELDAVLHDDLRALLVACHSVGCRVAVLDLRATTFMGIRAATMLAEAKLDAWRAGVELRVVSGRKEVERALAVAGVRHLFHYYPTMRAAQAC